MQNQGQKGGLQMSDTDLSGIYDDCYCGYDDYTAELTLQRDGVSGIWQNNSVKFYITSYGWAYEETSGGWNYGYDSLEEAVTKYTGALAVKSAKGKYIASRWLEKQYDCKLNPKTSGGRIECKVTKRMFKGECDYKRMDYINGAISCAAGKLC
jgi:hypothetical protein